MQYFAELGHLVINPISLAIREMSIVAQKLSSLIETICRQNKI
ncbi:MAG: hypothetical protein PG980_001032 [Wolbachia endosymbiont of Ctenocephalides felis wCfeJ]|nr:MAG: hypothetical protein PG980_001032 [Wolbachia endosymbiont of Ctenocephalides felis wCfeJ]